MVSGQVGVNNTRASTGAAPIDAIPPRYKRTEVGVIPEDWEAKPLGYAVDKLQAGISVNSVGDGSVGDNDEPAILKTSSVQSGTFLPHEAKPIAPKDRTRAKLNPRRDSILISRMNTIDLVGQCGYVDRDYLALFIPDRLWMTQFHAGASVSARWLSYTLSSSEYRKQLQSIATGTSGSMKNIAKGSLLSLPVAFPPPGEQRAIAEALSDVDGLLRTLEALVAKNRAIKQAAMQQLLTGKTRLPGFSGEWETKTIAEVASPCSEKNSLDEDLPVLTCSKHLGFVDSLGYFKSQVFSKDLSGYKIIRRGQIGYPANHIEEGSIGLQDLYDVALVSPIYVVCSPKVGVNSYFLHRLLKLDSYRQEFATATTSSVDRRGSLRWPAFSRIPVALPPIEEQTAIATVLADMDAEVAALERRQDKTKTIKQGMMQQLLTGRVRLVKPPDGVEGA